MVNLTSSAEFANTVNNHSVIRNINLFGLFASLNELGSKIISISNQKGGVGKTTTAVNLATALAAVNVEVLVIDLDPQGNASTSFGINKSIREKKNSYKLISQKSSAQENIVQTEFPRISIIPSVVDLAAVEHEVGFDNSDSKFLLKKVIAEIDRNKYKMIIIDCAPTLGFLTINAMTSSNSVLIPVQCEFLSLEGLAQLLQTISLVRKNLNKSLFIEGVLLTMYDKRNSFTEQVENEVRSVCGSVVYQTVIPRNVALAEAPSYGKPILLHNIHSKGAQAYIDLAKEVLFNNQISKL
jgi:chromosome partitioning protein